jgi:hypothetical protein
MTDKIHQLVDEVIGTSTPSLLALQTLQRVVPLSRGLVRAIVTDTTKASQPCSRLLLSVTKALPSLDADLGQTVQAYWMRRGFSTKALTGLYYGKAPYEGFVRDRIFNEMDNSQFVFSSLETWLPEVLSDQRFLHALFRLDNYPTCICQRLLYLKYLLCSSDIVPLCINVLPLLVKALTDDRYTECCASHMETVKTIFLSYASRCNWYASITLDDLTRVVMVFADILEVLVAPVVRSRGFAVAYRWLCDLLPGLDDRQRMTSQTIVCRLFDSGPPPDDFEFTPVDAELFAHILLSHTSPSVYDQIVDNLGPSNLNSSAWMDACDAVCHNFRTRSQFYMLMLACVPHLTPANLGRVTRMVFDVPHFELTGSSVPATELLCELHHHNPFASRFVTTEMAASCGDWDAVVECSNQAQNPCTLIRVLHRLETKEYVLPDDVLRILTEQAVRQSWTCPASCCVKYLSLIRRLSHYRAVVATIGSLRTQLEGLPKVLYKHLNHQRFVYFVRVWTAVIVLLPPNAHRHNLMNVLTLLSNYGVQKWNPSSTVLCSDVSYALARSLGWHELRILQARVVEGGPTYLLELMIQILYQSKVGRRRLLQVLSGVRGGDNSLTAVIVYYKVRVMLEHPSLRRFESIWRELQNESTSHRAWLYLLMSGPDSLLQALMVRLAEGNNLAILALYASELVRRCSQEACLYVLRQLLRKIDPACANVEAVLVTTRVVLERIQGDRVDLPPYTVQQFRALGETSLHSQCQVLATLLRLGIERERYNVSLLALKLPREIVREIKAFAVYNVDFV